MRSSCSAFSLVELLVSIGVVATLVAMSAVGIDVMKQRAELTKCGSNLRQLGTAALLYASEHDMCLPVTVHQRTSGNKSWTISLQEYAGGTIIFRCPSDEVSSRTYTYTINDFLTPNPAGAPDLDFSRLSRLERPSQTFLFAEASKNYVNSDHFHLSEYRGQTIPPAVFAAQVAVQRHNQASQFFFADGHVETLSWSKVKQLLQTPGCLLVDPTASGLSTN